MPVLGLVTLHTTCMSAFCLKKDLHTTQKHCNLGCPLCHGSLFLHQGPLYTQPKSCGHENLDALQNHPKVVAWEIEIHFCNCWVLKFSHEVKVYHVEGLQHMFGFGSPPPQHAIQGVGNALIAITFDFVLHAPLCDERNAISNKP